MVGDKHSLKISAPQLLQFGIDIVWKILNERMTYSVNESMNYKCVYRTAPATPGLLIMFARNVVKLNISYKTCYFEQFSYFELFLLIKLRPSSPNLFLPFSAILEN